MTIMVDDDEDSDRLYIDEMPPASLIKHKTGQTSQLRNVRKNSVELPPVNYLPLMRNYTLKNIQNNMFNASQNHRITVKDFARIPDANTNESNGSALYALLTEYAADLNAAVPMDNKALRTEAQDKDPKVAEIWVPTSNVYKPIPTDQTEPRGHTIHNYMNTPHDLSVPRIPPNACGDILGIPPKGNEYEIQNGNIIPHTPSAHINARQVSVIAPNSRNLSGGTMSYPPSTQTRNGNTNLPTANNSWQVQGGQTQYMNGYNSIHYSPPEYTARVNYQRTHPFMNCPLGYPRPSMMPAHNLNHHPCNPKPPPSPYMYACRTCNCQRLASANPHVMPTNPYGRDTAAYLAGMHKQCLQRNSYRMEVMRAETTNVVSSGHENQKRGAKTTNKRTYTKISKNTTQVVTNKSEIQGNTAVNIPNSVAIENEEITARKKVARHNTNTSKVNATIPDNNKVHTPSNIEIQQTKNNIEIPSIDLTSECTQPSMNNILNVIQPPLNTNTHLPLTTMRTNASANITTVSHYIADEMSNFKPIAMNINNDKGTPELMETQKGTINMNVNRAPPLMNTQLAIINHNRDEQIPLIMDQQPDSGFIQPPHNNIHRKGASTLLDNDSDRAQTDVTASSKTLTQSSSNAYGVNLTTSTTTKISHNIERNEILRSNTVNTESGSLLDVESASSILNTVDYRTETRVTTVEVVNHISNISVETLKDILNKVKQMPSKTATTVDQADDNQVNNCDDTVKYNFDPNKIIAHTISDDYIEERIDHKPQEIVSKHDDELEIARKKLAKFREIEHKNEDSSCKHIENIAQKDDENPYQLKITIGPNGEYIAQVISVCDNRSFVEDEQTSTSNTENISHSQIKQETEVLEEKKSIESNQEINEAIETRESIRNQTCDESTRSIDETLFFKFQINFFRLVQERLSENNCQELADELRKDIYDLIAISDDEGAKADMKYKCHMCRNSAVYSPRSFYYKVTDHQDSSLDKVQNCPLCIIFKNKYVDILVKYIEIEAQKETHSEINPHAVERNAAIVISTDLRQSESENLLHNEEYSKCNRQKQYCDIENQLSLITNGVPSSPKRAKIDDQARPNVEDVLDFSQTVKDSKTNDFVVKLPRNRLKESTVKALMQNSKFYPKKTDGAEATFNISTDNKSDKVHTHSENREQRKHISTEIATRKIAEKRNRDLNNSTNMSDSDRGLEVGKIINAAINKMYRNSNIDNSEENPREIVKSISAQDPTGSNTEEQNRKTISLSDNNERNDKYQKTPHKICRSISALKINLQQVCYNKDPQTNITSKLSNNNADIVRNKDNHTQKRASISDYAVTGINLEPKLRNANVIDSDDRHTNKSQEKIHEITKSISVETACNSSHDKNQEKHRKMKSISAETIATSKNTLTSSDNSDGQNNNEENREERKSISGDNTNMESPVTTNTPNNKHNNNTSVRIRELSVTIGTETTDISKTSTNTESNKSEFATAPQVTAEVTEKDDASKSYEKRGNNEERRNDDENDGKKVTGANQEEKRHNNDENDYANDGNKVTGANQEENSNKANQTVDKALDDSLKTLKANCNSKEELLEVKIPGKMQNKKIKSIENKPFEEIEKQNIKTKRQPFEEINHKFRCKVCTVLFKYHSACINHMKNNHKIHNPVIPFDCIYMECAFCELFVMVKLYNTHIKTVHSDKFSEQHE